MRQQTLKLNELGMTLLLSVLILSGIFIIVTTVSILAVQEIRASRASALSEPAIIAAETSGEQGIWLLKRSSFSTSCPAAGATQIDGTTAANSSGVSVVTTKCVSYDKAVFEVDPSKPAVFFLYDPNDINGNLCMYADDTSTPGTCDGQRLFRNIVFTMKLGSFSATANATTLDGIGFTGDTVTIPTNGSTSTITIPSPITGSSDERLRVTITSTSTVSVEVTTTGGYITGLPDYPTIDAEGCASRTNITSCSASTEIFKRRVSITVPR